MLVSIVISARNEYPHIVYTIHSILEDLASFLAPNEYEIIVVDNCSDDHTARRALGGTTDFIMARGMFHSGIVKVLHYPVASNVGARNHGAKFARGKYLIFSDAHMFYAAGTFQRWLQTIEESGGLVHPAVSWIGAFPPQKGYQYSWKLGEEFKGTWNNYIVTEKDWFYVPGMGHCSIGMLRQQFLDFGGYIENRCYGGGEMYLDSLWWMMGSCSVTEPRINCYHLSSERRYSYVHDDYIHNVFTAGLALNADKWIERAYLNYARRHKVEVLDQLWAEAVKTSDKQRAISANAPMSFDDMIRTRPWDTANETRHGKKNSGILIYHDTWFPLLVGTPAELLYKNAKHQEALGKFIDEHLGQFVYRRGTRTTAPDQDSDTNT